MVPVCVGCHALPCDVFVAIQNPDWVSSVALLIRPGSGATSTQPNVRGVLDANDGRTRL